MMLPLKKSESILFLKKFLNFVEVRDQIGSFRFFSFSRQKTDFFDFSRQIIDEKFFATKGFEKLSMGRRVRPEAEPERSGGLGRDGQKLFRCRIGDSSELSMVRGSGGIAPVRGWRTWLQITWLG